jgi:MFS family permease
MEGIPGALIAAWAVELPRIGRKGAMSIATVLTGVFLFCSTTARTSNALLGWNCGYNITSNIMYGVLYAYTPEIFPTKDRGTGNGLAATANRIFGVMAPIIASIPTVFWTWLIVVYADLTTSVPIYISGALFIVAGCLMLLLPYEPRGKTSL